MSTVKLGADEVLDIIDAENVAINVEILDDRAGAADVFARHDGPLEDLDTAGERRFVLLPSTLPNLTPGKAGASIETVVASLTTVYQLNTASLSRMLRDASRQRDAMDRVRDHAGIDQVRHRGLEPVYLPNSGVVFVTREIEVDYYAAVARRPRVVSTSPAALATGVAVAATLEVRFDRPMDTSTAPTLTDRAGSAVAHVAAWSHGDRVVSLTPTSPLTAGAIYVVTVSRGAVGADGTPIRGAHELRFCTEE